MKSTIYCVILAFLLCSSGWAQLRWENRNLELHPSVSDTSVVAEFHFTNIGKTPVRIKGVRTSCGCTTASLEKEIYAPGEKGKITAIFEIGSRTGEQEKNVYVATSDRKEPELMLSFKATVPKILEISPLFINWLKGEELKPKTVEVKVLNHFPVLHLEASSTSPNMTAEVKHDQGSRSFRIVVTPAQTAEGISASIEVTPDFPKEPQKVFHIYTRVDR